MLKTGFLVLAYRQPPMLARLAERLRHPLTRITVHLDAKVDAEPFRRALGERVNWVTNDRRVKVYWGGYSTLAAALATIEAALAADPDLERFVLLSGADYPVRPIDDILTEVALDRERISIERRMDWNDPDPFPHANRFFLGNNPLLNPRSAPRGLRRLSRRLMHAQRCLARRDDYGQQIYQGSGWWALTRRAVELSLDVARQQPRRLSWFRWTMVPEEMYFHTVLKNSGLAERIHHDRTRPDETAVPNLYGIHYIDWNRPNPWIPRTLEIDDLPAILASGALFARKVHEVRSAELMAVLDRAPARAAAAG